MQPVKSQPTLQQIWLNDQAYTLALPCDLQQLINLLQTPAQAAAQTLIQASAPTKMLSPKQPVTPTQPQWPPHLSPQTLAISAAVAVALNQQVVPKQRWAETPLSAGDQVFVFQLVAGG